MGHRFVLKFPSKGCQGHANKKSSSQCHKKYEHNLFKYGFETTTSLSVAKVKGGIFKLPIN